MSKSSFDVILKLWLQRIQKYHSQFLPRRTIQWATKTLLKKIFSSDKNARGQARGGSKRIYLFWFVKCGTRLKKKTLHNFGSLKKKYAFHSHLCHMDLWVSIWFSLEEFTELLINVIDSLPFTLHDLSEENLIR